ncbi:MAG: hypothetical protein IJD42_02570 [Clostridia bacterium]|nr:hypothetical protein [Clostridia bacterium]
MREKIYSIINKVYGALLMTSFFAGFLPIIPFIVAIIIGGPSAEKICLFLYNQYYPWVIAIASISIIVGLVGMYVAKMITFGIKKKPETKEESPESQPEGEQNAN